MLALLAVAFFYLVLSHVIFTIIRKQTLSMTLPEVMLVYGAKILAGCLYGYIFLQYYNGDDTWAMHAHSITEKKLLLNNPLQFFWEFTPGPAIKGGRGLLEISSFYLTDLEYCLQAKILGIFNIVTGDNYYINIVFWNFIVFWGHFWLFKLLVTAFPAKRKLFFVLIFLFPPALFWLSGIRADGLLFVSFALLLLNFYRSLSHRRFASSILWITGLIGVLIFRREMALLLMPALISLWLAHRFPQKAVLHFGWVYSLTTVFFFASTALPSLNFPAIVADRQHKFMQLRGTAFHLDKLEPSVQSFGVVLPQAFMNTFVRPYPWEAEGILQLMASLEIVFFWGMLIFIFLKHDHRWKDVIIHPLVLLLLFFGTSLYIFIGYTVPFPGAIVRYKIIGELCLLSAFFAFIKPPNPDLRLK